MSNLQIIARRCPVMSKALAVQSVHHRAASAVAASPPPAGNTRPAVATGFCRAPLHQKRHYVVPSKPVSIQATPKVPAQADTIESVHLKAGVYDTSKGICPHGVAAMRAANAAANLPFTHRPAPVAATCPHSGKVFNYEDFYQRELDKKHKDKSYRYFNNINRLAKNFPKAHMETKDKIVTVFCSNDYVCLTLLLLYFPYSSL